MKSAKDSIKPTLLGLFAFFFLSTPYCSAGGTQSKVIAEPEKPISEQNVMLIAYMERRLGDLGHLIRADGPTDRVGEVSPESYYMISFYSKRKSPYYEYYSHDMSSMQEYADDCALIQQIKDHIDASNKYVAKECLGDFITMLEDKELGYDIKALEFGKLVLELRAFYFEKFQALGFRTAKWHKESDADAAATVARYHAEKEPLKKALELTMYAVCSFLYIILKELRAESPDSDNSKHMLQISLAYGCRFLAPFANPKLPIISETGCMSSDTGGSGAGSEETSSRRSSGSSSESFRGASCESTPPVVGQKSDLGSHVVPEYSLS